MPRDLTPKDFVRAMTRNGFAMVRTGSNHCRDVWYGRPIPPEVAPVRNGRTLLRRATLDACLAAREAEHHRRRIDATKVTARLEFAARLAPNALSEARSALDGDAAIGRMADDMIEIAARGGGCDRDDLALRGWRFEQIDTFGVSAREAAQRRQEFVAA